MEQKKRGGRFPNLDKDVQDLVIKAEQAKEENQEEALEELKKKLKKVPAICGAVMGGSKVCMRKPISDNGRCAVHGGKATGAKTEEGREKALSKLNPKANLIHGIYSADFKDKLTKEEVEFYNETMEWFLKDNELDPVNIALLDRYILNFIKQARKDSVKFLDESPSYNDFETKMIRFAETLGLNKKFRDSKDNKGNTSNFDITMLFSSQQSSK
ncbi:HGGxSTG domain-containing protein [Priestia megaterium]|uniref:HGGxSTG domain-containing protein n=1 Tax=Priestia megaterium TaxID=1404 RepID=UPI00207929FD|nr:HGGxSTG domain-containing protein [Priestia megaterium]USL32933.1 hypothetical protein LIT30_12290 [Priestia megaterium]